jgi:hypothetical protein
LIWYLEEEAKDKKRVEEGPYATNSDERTVRQGKVDRRFDWLQLRKYL